MRFVDTHAHITLSEFEDDRDAVIKRALDAGVSRLITIGIDVESSRACVDLASRYEGVYATVGLHPNCLNEVTEDDFNEIARLTQAAGVVGIGETGLDFYRDRSSAETQIEWFRRHIQLGRENDLPVVVHDREAHDAVLKVLREEHAADAGVVLHCFTGDEAMAAIAIDAGYHISFGGVVTFKNTMLASVVAAVPSERLLIETDAPYLSPAPFRGRRNEPARVVHTAEAISRFREVSIEDIAAVTTRNATLLFGLLNTIVCIIPIL